MVSQPSPYLPTSPNSVVVHILTGGMVVVQEALANKQACHPNQPLRAPMPSHWTDMPPSASVEYVELPLPPGCSPACGPLADPPALPPLDEGVLKAMMYQVWSLPPPAIVYLPFTLPGG